MTRFTVTWRNAAQDHLAQLWTDAPDRQAIADAANTIDSLLPTDPGSKGTEVSEGLRNLHVPPLYILFTVRELDRLVEVVSVRTDQPSSIGPQGNGQRQPPDKRS
jgi:hypothetical protein